MIWLLSCGIIGWGLQVIFFVLYAKLESFDISLQIFINTDSPDHVYA